MILGPAVVVVQHHRADREHDCGDECYDDGGEDSHGRDLQLSCTSTEMVCLSIRAHFGGVAGPLTETVADGDSRGRGLVTTGKLTREFPTGAGDG
ncbi:hypothetical protein Ntsu_42590 [Nocardia sp. IFM 10818]